MVPVEFPETLYFVRNNPAKSDCAKEGEDRPSFEKLKVSENLIDTRSGCAHSRGASRISRNALLREIEAGKVRFSQGGRSQAKSRKIESF
jgi:hypothetical protein